MNRNTLALPRGGQKFPAFVNLEFRHEVVKASGASIQRALFVYIPINLPKNGRCTEPFRKPYKH